MTVKGVNPVQADSLSAESGKHRPSPACSTSLLLTIRICECCLRHVRIAFGPSLQRILPVSLGACIARCHDRIGPLSRKNQCYDVVLGAQSTVSEKLCEVELELIEGESTDPLFDLAIELAGEFSSASRNRQQSGTRRYSLAMGLEESPRKGLNVAIGREMLPVEAFRSVASACLIQLQRNEAGAIASENPEFVHQARVAIRRLRSALKLFSPALSVDFIAVYSPRWQELARKLGEVRDWDVFLAETLTPLEKDFPDNPGLARVRIRALARRSVASVNASRALAQQAYSQLLRLFGGTIQRNCAIHFSVL